MNWGDVGVIGSLTISAFVALNGVFRSRKVDRSAKAAQDSAAVAQTVELGVKTLVDQYREANEELRDEVHECAGKCRELESTVRGLRRELDGLRTAVDNKDAEIIRLKVKAGEL